MSDSQTDVFACPIDVALSGFTASDEIYVENVTRCFRNAKKAMLSNLCGLVTKDYDVPEDRTFFVFGGVRIPTHLNPSTGHYWPDDPMAGRFDIPLSEFLAYLRDWYHPKYQSMHPNHDVLS